MNSLSKVLIVSLIAFSACQSNSQTQPTLPSSELFPFHPQKYTDVPEEIKAKLYIPYLEDEKYGIANYGGEVLLQPQFEYIVMIDLAVPYFWAGTFKNSTLYDIKGKQIVDIDNQPIYKSEVSFVRYEKAEGAVGFEAPLLLKIKHTTKGYLPAQASVEERKATSSTVEVEEFDPGRPSNRYYYLNTKTKGKPVAYFSPSYEHLPTSNAGRTWFSFDYSMDSLTKVMTKSGQFTLLDLDGNPIVEPNWNCVPLAPNKMKLFHKNGLCALKDPKEGWQTDFLFKEIQWTKHPDIFTAEVWRPKTEDPSGGKYKVNFLITKGGKVTELLKGEEWNIADKEYSVVQKTTGNPTFQTKYTLWDNMAWKAIREIPTNRFYSLFGKKGVDLNGKSKPKAFLSIEGDTVALPKYDSYSALNDTLAYFNQGVSKGLINSNLKEIFRIDSTTMRITWDSFFIIKKDKKKGLISLQGEEILPLQYDRIDVYPLKNWIFVKQGDSKNIGAIKYGLFDIKGNPILPIAYKQLYASAFTFGEGTGLELKTENEHYVVNSDFEIIVEKNKKNPILTKGLYKVSGLEPTIQEDYDNASLPKLYTHSAVLKGRNYVHIFHSDGTYITSFEGRAPHPEITIYTGSRHARDLGQVRTGILKVRRKSGVEVYVRLHDGYVYQK